MKATPILALAALAAAQSGRYGAYPSGWTDFNGGDTAQAGKAMQKMMGNLKPPAEILRSGGSGRYPARALEDASLPGHTIFAPKNPPAGAKLPVLLWGNGGCLAMGQVHGGVLTDIASHGYVVVANGGKDPAQVSFSKNTDMFDGALWAASKGAKYGADATRVATAGQSCGGMQAYTANQAPNVKTTIIFNSGLLGKAGTLRPRLANKLKGSILYMEGGRSDPGYSNGKSDYNSLTSTPAVFLSQNTGHAVNKRWHPLIIEWLNWQLKGEGTTTARAKFVGSGSLAPFTEHMSKNWK